MLTVRLCKEMDERLNFLSKKTHRSKSYFVKKALSKFLEEEEELEWATIAYREFLESGAQTLSHEDFLQKNQQLNASMDA